MKMKTFKRKIFSGVSLDHGSHRCLLWAVPVRDLLAWHRDTQEYGGPFEGNLPARLAAFRDSIRVMSRDEIWLLSSDGRGADVCGGADWLAVEIGDSYAHLDRISAQSLDRLYEPAGVE